MAGKTVGEVVDRAEDGTIVLGEMMNIEMVMEEDVEGGEEEKMEMVMAETMVGVARDEVSPLGLLCWVFKLSCVKVTIVEGQDEMRKGQSIPMGVMLMVKEELHLHLVVLGLKGSHRLLGALRNQSS